MKKLVSLFLALALCLGLGAAALADGEVELPDAAQFLSAWLEDHSATVELIGQDRFGTVAIAIENVQDMQTIYEKTLSGLDLLFQMNDFQRISGEDQWSEVSDIGEYLYAYTGSASLGTLEDSEGTEGNVFVVLMTGGEHVDGIEVRIVMGDGISMKLSGTDTDAGTAAAADVPASGADNILPDAWAFFHGEVNHEDKLITNGRLAYFGLEWEDRQACYEYIDLLQSGRFGFTLTDTWEGSDRHKTVYCVFDYPGAGPDQEVTREVDDRNVSGDLIVEFKDWGNDLWCDLRISFSDALAVVDTGDRCTDTELRDFYIGISGHVDGPMGSGASESDSSSSAGGGSHDDDDDDDDYTPHTPKPEQKMKQKCYKCNGDGDVECSQCDGAGGKWIYDSVPNYSGEGYTTTRTWQRCSKCSGTGEMTCPICHGEGTI